ncbi:uracil phosphoribosyltransferase [candidate division WOR-3 bacterium]|nr:uracil phosphoribosyltransferase [candidate division WOR-3 bacterium]MCK4528160.1 uracil phosphoribosyltransferase [candidate division WOR-3 bacterium]
MIHILENKVLSSMLTVLRNENTKSSEFREKLRLAGFFLTYEILNGHNQAEEIKVRTPLILTTGVRINAPILQLVVMRAGMHLAIGGGELMDQLNIPFEIGVVDAKRLEEDAPDLDFDVDITSFKVPSVDKKDIIIYEPMLATGGTITKILTKIYEKGMPLKLIIASIVSAPFGVEKIEKLFPDVHIYTLAFDEQGEFKGLNGDGYIVPGLGDCGDRAFGTY